MVDMKIVLLALAVAICLLATFECTPLTADAKRVGLIVLLAAAVGVAIQLGFRLLPRNL